MVGARVGVRNDSLGRSGTTTGVMDVHWPYMTDAETRRRNRRLEVRTTTEERELIDRAVAEQGVDLTEFVVSNAITAARRVLADRTEFALDAQAARAWDEVNARPARDLSGLRRLLKRPSPFAR